MMLSTGKKTRIDPILPSVLACERLKVSHTLLTHL